MRTIHRRHRDAQRAVPAGECALCGAEIYPGSLCWRLGGRLLCEECVVPWLLEELSVCRIRLREVRG